MMMGTAWSMSSGLLAAVVSILVATADVTTGLKVSVATVCDAAGVTCLTSGECCLDCARFTRADIADVSVDPESAGTGIAELTVVLTEVDNLLGDSFKSGFPALLS